MKEQVIRPDEAGQRVDKFLLREFPQMAKSFLYKMFRKKNICLNKQRIVGNEILKAGDRLAIYFSDTTYQHFKESNRQKAVLTAEIIYEDELLLAVNKPVNLLSQPNGHQTNLIDQLATYTNNPRIGVINRLDRNTTGLILAGKTIRSLQVLAELSRQHRLIKTYHCLVKGELKQSMVLENYLLKDTQENKVILVEQPQAGARKIVTELRSLQVGSNMTLVEVKLRAGKTHQIRKHLASIGYPIVGDTKYGDMAFNRTYLKSMERYSQLLHCRSLVVESALSSDKEVNKFLEPSFHHLAKIEADYPSAMTFIMNEQLIKS